MATVIVKATEMIENKTITTDKKYILLEILQGWEISIIEITAIERKDNMARLTAKDCNSNETRQLGLASVLTLHKVPFANREILSLTNGKYIIEYENITTTKRLVRGLTAYGPGMTPYPLIKNLSRDGYIMRNYMRAMENVKQICKRQIQ